MIEFKLPDMSCGHCVSVVTRTLKSVDPACEVDIDLKAQLVHVNTGTDREKLAAALTEAGYTPA